MLKGGGRGGKWWNDTKVTSGFAQSRSMKQVRGVTPEPRQPISRARNHDHVRRPLESLIVRTRHCPSYAGRCRSLEVHWRCFVHVVHVVHVVQRPLLSFTSLSSAHPPARQSCPPIQRSSRLFISSRQRDSNCELHLINKQTRQAPVPLSHLPSQRTPILDACSREHSQPADGAPHPTVADPRDVFPSRSPSPPHVPLRFQPSPRQPPERGGQRAPLPGNGRHARPEG